MIGRESSPASEISPLPQLRSLREYVYEYLRDEGKKSLLRHLATAHPGRVAITATASTTYFQENLGFAVAIDADERLPAVVARLDRPRTSPTPVRTQGRAGAPA